LYKQEFGLAIDVETTGLGPATDEVIELALKLFTYRTDTGEIQEVIEEDSFLREPISSTAQRNYDRAYRVHGIPYEMVKGKTFFDSKIKSYFHRADSVFAHNASFDRSFLYYMYPEVNELRWFCTMRGVQWKNYGFQNGKLLTLLQAHNISNFQTHRALDDITYLVELLKKTSPTGNLYLQEVLEKGPMKKYKPAASIKKLG
jgi:DNA polymerase III subunit epsilon